MIYIAYFNRDGGVYGGVYVNPDYIVRIEDTGPGSKYNGCNSRVYLNDGTLIESINRPEHINHLINKSSK